MSHINHSVFNQKNFWRQFSNDLHSAKGLILIQSPFLALRRIETLREDLETCISRRVRVCVFVQKPDERKASTVESRARDTTLKSCVDLLNALGIHVNLRPLIHEKLIVIDDDILWDGSLNVLSYSESLERMTRWVSREKVNDAIVQHNLATCVHCPLKIRDDLTDTFADERKRIGALIATERKRQKITQFELGQKTGVTQPTVSAVENGVENVRLSTVLKVCRGLELSLAPTPWYMVPSLTQIVRKPR